MNSSQIFILGVVFSAIVILGIFIFAYEDGNNCIANPILYGIDKMENEKTGQVNCQCSFQDPRYENIYFQKGNMSIGKSFLFP